LRSKFGACFLTLTFFSFKVSKELFKLSFHLGDICIAIWTLFEIFTRIILLFNFFFLFWFV
jgi:hypothetical protein